MLWVLIFLGSNISGTSRSYNLAAAGLLFRYIIRRCTVVVLKLVYCVYKHGMSTNKTTVNTVMLLHC